MSSSTALYILPLILFIHPVLSSYQGLYTHHLNEGVRVIVPRKVNHLGEIVSHTLTHHHTHGEDESHSDRGRRRGRRSVVESNPSQQLHYHIDIDDETLHVELEPSTASFVAPLMVIERHRRDVRTRVRPMRNINCHYQGQVRGHDQSRVALSACNGLAGVLRTNRTEYWIEPAKHHPQGPNGEHPHVVFKRADVKETPAKKNSRSAIKKKKRKRKKRHLSNCGTREPRRLTETRLEWQHQGKVLVQGGRKTRNQHPDLTASFTHTGHREEGERKMAKPMGKGKARTRRSISKPRHVEALVVADHSMVQFHQDVDLQQYLLMIMNMVSSLYKDPTIGNSIQVTVVKIIILEEEDSHADFNVTHMASNTLENFCRWQRNLNPKPDEDPHHHDVAILVTRKNICSNYGCATLGVANVGGMCRPDKSCSVNEDNGITLAHTISHELGHNFGMYHDTAKTGCDHRIGPILHIMTPSFEADTMQVSWSNCSRRDITHFLDQGLGKCLEDAPSQEEYEYPELPPGAMYNADLQCRLQFNSTDEDMTVCSKLDEICTQLWCLVGEVCTTMLRPAAPGTNCGRRMWCQNQKCVDVEELPAPVDGGWGDWSPWSECSRSCGVGIAKQTRECDHPSPAHGGMFCIGERARYKTCHVQACPLGTPSFRAEQCSAHDNDTIKGEKYSWLPYFDKNEPCELYCSNTEDTMIVPFGDTAADGTFCNLGTNDMCIGGICRKVGCDWVVDSNTTEDRCGVCGGTGDTCFVKKGEINKKINTTDGVHDVLMIPAGARNVLIEEILPSKNFIGVGRSTGNECYLNCNHFIQLPGEYEVASSLCLYERENEQERLKIPGPIMEDVNVFIVIKKKNNQAGIRYEYTLPSHNGKNQSAYYWKLTDWSVCSATCGGGKQFRESICYHRGKGVAKEELCLRHAFGKRHELIARDCNDDPCPFNWWVGPWQLCLMTCRKPHKPVPIRRRSILCVDSNSNARPDTHCNNKPRPHDKEPCGEELPVCQENQRSGQETERPDTIPFEEFGPSDLPSPSTPADDYEVNNNI
ncbi:A disintegrin and metalloproteinase with thrombospondin motifs 7 [Anopheles merus]|uniref:Peptidase M12B domain-containing protein n=1 Tax=Anopheles merus TaxID=30066 RepID=A0A182UR56_ANOME|nr:A disintegrin and metalloproteinase with thrombospondin motifs 7 [Anopheles merus]XP_041764890.1 A disintegrin and metalloproteinase with thrombospondin motifs 7 [Anopheles merus]